MKITAKNSKYWRHIPKLVPSFNKGLRRLLKKLKYRRAELNFFEFSDKSGRRVPGWLVAKKHLLVSFVL